ncbi:MAG: hypothetical protein QXL01_05625 [Thermoplasmatales archaeon]
MINLRNALAIISISFLCLLAEKSKISPFESFFSETNLNQYFLEGMCVSFESTSVDCESMRVVTRCIDRESLPGASGSTCYSDGVCVLTLVKTEDTDDVLSYLPKLCDSNLSIEELNDIMRKIRELIKNGLKLNEHQIIELIRILYVLAHEKQHCADRCRNPRMRSCESELSATNADIAEMKKLAEDLRCYERMGLRRCGQILHLLDISAARLSFFECLCENQSDCAVCVGACKKACESATQAPGMCANYCDRLPSHYCK